MSTPAGIPIPSLEEEIRRFGAGTGSRDYLLAALRAAPLHLRIYDTGIAVRTHPGSAGHWIAACTSLDALARQEHPPPSPTDTQHHHEHDADRHANDEVRYVTLTGADLIDTVLPAMPDVVGIGVDLAEEYPMLFPAHDLRARSAELVPTPSPSSTRPADTAPPHPTPSTTGSSVATVRTAGRWV